MMWKTSRRSNVCAALLALAGVVALGPAATWAADHLDGPRLMTNPQALGNLDINDVYIFKGGNPNYTVLIMTLSPSAGVLGPESFSTLGVYEFHIVNDGSTADSLIIRFIFGPLDATGHQSFQYIFIDPAGSVVLAGKGTTGQNTKVAIPGGLTGIVRPDLYDDPFFFDLNAFNTFKAQALMNNPVGAAVYNPSANAVFNNRNVKDIPQNFFAGFNVMAIVLEVPSVLLQSTPANHMIGVWARTVLNQGIQFDRMGRPAINTVLIPDNTKDLFNSAVPPQDPAFIPIATQELTRLFGPTNAQAHAEFLLSPGDILTFDTSSSQGFLNGRGLDDDVIDTELNLLSNGAITGDGVVNDSVFQSVFPYLGTPNPKSTPLVLTPIHKPKPKGKQRNLLSNGAITGDGVVSDSVFQSVFPHPGTSNPKSTPLNDSVSQSVFPHPGTPSPESTPLVLTPIHKPKPKGKH